MADVTRILNAIDHGDGQAAKELLPLVYDQLRKLAAERLAHEIPGQTLQATALVHEAYLRLTGDNPNVDEAAGASRDKNRKSSQRFANRSHFFAAAAESMRRILVEIARRKKRRRDLIAREPPPFESACDDQHDLQLDLVALDEALGELAGYDARKARLVELRFFAGLSEAETADCLGISPATAARDWAFARAWLHRRLHCP